MGGITEEVKGKVYTNRALNLKLLVSPTYRFINKLEPSTAGFVRLLRTCRLNRQNSIQVVTMNNPVVQSTRLESHAVENTFNITGPCERGDGRNKHLLWRSRMHQICDPTYATEALPKVPRLDGWQTGGRLPQAFLDSYKYLSLPFSLHENFLSSRQQLFSSEPTIRIFNR